MSDSSAIQVFKFGGSSVGSPDAIRLALTRIREAGPHVVAVVSAMSGVTDLLLGATEQALAGRVDEAISAAKEFESAHKGLVSHLVTSARLRDELDKTIAQSTHELISMCESIAILRELTSRTRDAVAARGERMMARIVATALRDGGTECSYVDAADVITIQRRHGSLWPDFDACERAAATKVAPLLAAGHVIVIPGFIGRGPDGEVVTLGRGGTDFSAAIVARSLHAAALTLWKEVDGLMTADPKSVPDARVLPELHYREAGELAYYGAKVLHPRTMIPLVERGIPLYVKNSFNPSFSGTRIAGDVVSGSFPVKALTAVHGQALMAVEGSGMIGVPGIAARTFAALAHGGHSVSMISQASSEASICFVLPASEANDAKRALEEAFELELQTQLIDSIRVDRDVAMIAVVGTGMRGTPGIASRTFTAISNAQVNVIAIAQGSSELNITAAIRESDATAALVALHREFQLDKVRPLPKRERHESSLTFLGMGQIGRTLTRQIITQESYFRHDLGIRLKSIALVDRSGIVVEEEGFSSNQLEEIVRQKEAGVRLAVRKGSEAEGVQFIADEMKRLVWTLPSSRSIVVDLTADETAPLLTEALRRHCHVVVANKKPLAVPQAEFDQMMEIARDNNLAFRYEATVGAGLPILDTLAKLKEAGDRVDTILGCLSGTIGYLMTQLEDGVAWSDAVRQAHALGYTEPDPRDDLSGIDVARKALILARTLGRKLDLSDIAIEPLFPAELSNDNPYAFIENLKVMDEEMRERIARARANHEVLRYVARIEGGGIRVGLENLSEAAPMGRLRGTDNQVVLKTRRYEANPLIVTGPGAGAEVTAAGVLNDIIAITMR